MHNATKYGVLLAILAVMAVPSAGLGQSTGKVSLEARGGLVFPVSDLGKVNDLGGSAGGSVLWNFHPNWALRFDVDYMGLDDGTDGSGTVFSPPMDLLYYGGAVEVNFNAPRYQDFPLKFMASLGLGSMSMKVDETYDFDHPANGFDHTYLAMQLGAKAGWQVTPWINIFLNSSLYMIFLDDFDTLVWVDGEVLTESFDLGWVIPLTLGARLTFLPW